MKNILLFFAFLFCTVLNGAIPPPYQPNPWSTNVAGTTVQGGTTISIDSQTLYLNTNQLVLSNGWTGIGTNFPRRPVHIVNNTQAPFRVERNSSLSIAGHVEMYNPNTTDGNSVSYDLLSDSTGSGASSGISFGAVRTVMTTHDHPTRAGDMMFFTLDAVEPFEKLRIKNKGQVGIGTNAPVARLHVVGNGINNDLLRIGTTKLDPVSTVNSNGVSFTVVRTNYNSTNWAPLTTNIAQQLCPMGQFGFYASAISNNLELSGAVTDYTNFLGNGTMERMITNGFVGSKTSGIWTNVYAGYYTIIAEITVWPDVDNNGDEIEAEIFLNGVGQELTSDVHTLSNGIAEEVEVLTFAYIPASTSISFRIRNRSDATSALPVIRSMFLVKSF